MNDWYSSVYKAFTLAAALSFIIGFFTTSNTSLGAYMAGYSVLSMAIIMILVSLFMAVDGNSLYAMLVASGPFVVMIGVVAFALYMSVKYQSNIVDGRIAPGYHTFSNIIVLLLLTQLYLIYTSDRPSKLPKITSSILYLIGTVNGICSIILYTILKYYSTDGFTSSSSIM